MSKIEIKDLTFYYDDFYHPVFENVSFCLDTDWKLALIGRNGRGKTTLLKLLQGSLEPSGGKINRTVGFSYFPYEYDGGKFVKTMDVIKECIGGLKTMEILIEQYSEDREGKNIGRLTEILDVYDSLDGFGMEGRIYRETAQMGLAADLLERDFSTLSGGEATCMLIIALFLKKDSFVLLDEPTNHLDTGKKEHLKRYLMRKKGFVIVSHDGDFLDAVTDHVLAINKTDIGIEQGNFSTWRRNFEVNELYELRAREKLMNEIGRLERQSKVCRSWSEVGNGQKYDFAGNARTNGTRSYMRQAKRVEQRVRNDIEEKKRLLRNMEQVKDLEIDQDMAEEEILLEVKDLSFGYEGGKTVLKNVSFRVKPGDKVWIRGRNGAGKTTLLNILSGRIACDGIFRPNNLSIAYVWQEPYWKNGNMAELMEKEAGRESFGEVYAKFLDICGRFDLPEDFGSRPFETLSDGEKKKADIARCLSISRQMIILDEPLNYMDDMFKMQLENAVADRDITMVFVEHDEGFGSRVANKAVCL